MRVFAIVACALRRSLGSRVAPLLAFAGLSAAAGAFAAAAGPSTAILVPALGNGFDYYQGSYNLGWTFVPNVPITVTALGFYDDLQNGLAQSHPVAIYDKATQGLLASATVVPTDPLSGYFRYTPLATPLTLLPGNTYVLISLVLSEYYLAFYAIDPLWTVDPAITYTGSAVNYANPSATTLLYPDTFSATGGDFGPNFQFTAATGPAVSLAPANLVFSAQGVGSTSPAQTVALSNTGASPLNIAGVAVTGDFAANSNCPAALAPAGSCQFSVTFTPLAPGTRAGAITVSDDAPGAPHVVGLSGTGITSSSPSISVSPSLAFPPAQVLATSAPLDLGILNTGSADLVIYGVGISGSDFVVVNEDCTRGPLPPGGTCIVRVAFAPMVTGTRNATLNIVANTPGVYTYIALSGTGTAAPSGTLSAPGSLAFGEQLVGSSSAPKVVSIANTGNFPVAVQSVELSGDFTQTNDCGQIAAGGTCSVTVVFRPTAVGSRTGTLTLLSDASDPALSVVITGLGTHVSTPVIALSATSLMFGNRVMGVESNAQDMILGNVGGADLSIAGFDVNGDFATTVDCPAVVSPGATCRISVSFLPRIPGERLGVLRVRSNAASGDATVNLAGTGCRPFSLAIARLATPFCP